MGEFVNPLSGQTHGVDDQVITMTMAEIQEHERHVNELFAEKEARIKELEETVTACQARLSSKQLGDQVPVVISMLKRVMGGA